MRPLTKTEFAKERKVSRARVYQYIDDGRVLVLVDGRIDADDAHARLDASLDQTKGVRAGGNVTSSAPTGGQGLIPLPAPDKPEESAAKAPKDAGLVDWQSRARKDKAEAQLAEMKVLKEAGALVSAGGVRKVASETARGIRNGILAVPDRTAAVLASMTSPTQIHNYLTGELQKVLREFSTELEQRAAAAAGAEEPEPTLV